MKEIPRTLFDHETIARLTSQIKLEETQKESVQKWKKKLDEEKIGGESKFSTEFAKTILIEVLGYDFDTGLEQDDNKMDYSYVPKTGKDGIVFELKSFGKNLEENQHRTDPNQKTPIDQTLDYILKNKKIEYGLCTNYQRFQLVTRQEGKVQCYVFDFPEKGEPLTDEHIIEFVSVFSKDSIDNGHVETIRKESEEVEEKIEEDFYKLFHQTRLMLVESFKEKFESLEAVKFAQMYLNRLIFVFFSEDNDLVDDKLFTSEVKEILDSDIIKEKTIKISDHIQTIFSWMNSGNDRTTTNGFNGELFKEEIDRNAYFVDFPEKDLRKKLEKIQKEFPLAEKDSLKGELKNSVQKYSGKLNPIIQNLLMMGSKDFSSEINVNILGHIFENSIGALEELRGEETEQKKKEGVFYTPPYVTDYICRNTIVPYLSKTGTNDIGQLVNEFKDDIYLLERKVREIKILDPACGSGAFLIKAIDVLLEIQNAINEFKIGLGKFKVTKKGRKYKHETAPSKMGTLDPDLELVRTMDIVHENIYGTDRNHESIEITKLSLFLKIASKDRQLISLSKRILKGNSLVADKSLAPDNFFDWKSGFNEIFPDEQQKQIFKERNPGKVWEEGFDIVIGNPPYVYIRDFTEEQAKQKDYIANRFKDSIEGMWDLFVPFVHLGLNLLKEGGNFSMIIKDTIGVSGYTKKLVEFIESNYDLYQIDFYPKIHLFKRVNVYNKILFIKKTKNLEQTKRILHSPTKVDTEILPPANGWEKYDEKSAEFSINETGTISLGKICYVTYGLRPNSDKDDPPEFKKEDVISETKNERCHRRYLKGDFLEKYSIVNEMFIEWDSERIPDRCYRSTFRELYEPEKLLMSRQKGTKAVAYSNEKQVCDTTINMGIRYVELKGVENLNTQMYFSKLKSEFDIDSDRKTLEEISKKFDLKYLMGILNSNLVKYHLHYNSGGNLDSTPNDWKKIPIKDILKSEQEPFIKMVNSLIKEYGEFHSKKNRLTDKIRGDFDIGFDKDFDLLTSSEEDFVKLIRKTRKVQLTPKIELEWQEVFAKSKKTLCGLYDKISPIEKSLNDMVYSQYGVSDKDRTIIESDISQY